MFDLPHAALAAALTAERDNTAPSRTAAYRPLNR